ncbi:MAG: LuxR C-terminal-related transcriptional regulator [Nitrospirota bacterium]
MLQTILSAFLDSTRALVHPSVLQCMLQRIGVQIGRQVSEQHRLTLGLSLPFSRKEYGRCLSQSLPERMGWPCSLLEETADRLRFNIPSCPFGRSVAGNSDFCRLTSGVFGGIAADQFGYAKVCLTQGHGTPPRNCCVTVYIRKTDESMAAEGTVYPEAVTAAGDWAETPARQGALPPLSSRECGLLRLVGEGLTDKEIAAALNLSVRTVENHGARLREKLGVSGRVGLVRFALRHHLAKP